MGHESCVNIEANYILNIPSQFYQMIQKSGAFFDCFVEWNQSVLLVTSG